ncbi:SDR family oxidoreductase, partial [Streptomyces sp. YIM 98790]|uniref:SDR family oxidoreductase n=1 Tax=Streptomyces sp. YIM 98790 TaxID=2689077 RepID=UPI00140E9310
MTAGPPAPHGRTAALLHPGAPGADVVARALADAGLRLTEPGGPAPPDVCCAVLTGETVLGHRTGPRALDRRAAAETADAMAGRGSGRMLLVTDFGPEVHGATDPGHAAARAADLAFWRHLAARAAPRGVLLNQIRVGAAPFLASRGGRRRQQRLLPHLALHRGARPADLAAAVRQAVAAGTSYTVGDTLRVDGGLGLGHIAPPGAGRPAPGDG